MTSWKPTSLSPPNESLDNSLNESQSSCGIGKTILAVYNKGDGDSSTFKGYDDGSVSVSSFSEGGFMADVSEGESTSVSETSEYFSEPVVSSLLVDSSLRQAARPKRQVKRKAGSKQKEPTADSQQKSTATLTRRKKATKKKPLNKKKTKKKMNDSSDYLHAEFNASVLNAGASMQGFLTDSQTEGGTDNEANKNNTRPTARRKRKIKRCASYDHSSSGLSLTDGSKKSQSVRSRLSINEPRTKKTQHKLASDAENSDSKKSRSVKRRSTKGIYVKKATKETKADDEKDSIDDASITLESLYPTTPAPDAVKPKLLLEQSAASLRKDASLDLAKHGPVAKGRKSITLNTQASGKLHRGRSLPPETKRRESSAKPKTISEAKQKVKSRSKSPRRLKSRNTTIQSDKKLIRRTKSDFGPGDQKGQPRSTRSSSKTKKQPKTTGARPVKQRSQSLTLAAQSSTNITTCRRRRLQTSVSSKVSLSMSLTAMDKSFQSMPSNVPKRPSISLPAQLVKDTLGDTQSTSTDINKKTVKRSTSAGFKAVTSPKTVTTRKKRLGATNKRPGASKPIPPKPASEVGQDGTAHIAKASRRHTRSNLDALPSVPKKKANDPISPFSLRANLEDVFLAGENDDDDDVFSRSEVSASSTQSGTSSNSGGQTRTTAASGTSAGSLQGLSKGLLPTHRSGTPNNLPAISSYFGRDEEIHNSQDPLREDSMEKAGDSMSGSLLSDYSSSDNDTATKKTQKGALGLSSSDVSSDAMGQSRTTISPFSVHAGDISSNHTTATLLATDHNATPLIPDSDDETSDSFHEETPQLISSVVDEAPPLAHKKSLSKQSVSKVTDPPVKAQKPDAKNHKQPKISFPQPNQNSEQGSSRRGKPKVNDQLNSEPQPFWQMLCCRSWRHAREV